MSYNPTTLRPIRVRFDQAARQYKVEQAYTPQANGAFWPQDLNDIVNLNETAWRARATCTSVLEAAMRAFTIMYEENVALLDFELGPIPANSEVVSSVIGQLERVRF